MASIAVIMRRAGASLGACTDTTSAGSTVSCCPAAVARRAAGDDLRVPGGDHAHEEWTERAEVACLTFFCLELLVRLRRDGRAFLRSRWTLFDVVLIVLALLPAVPVGASALRLVRLGGRVARLAHLSRHAGHHVSGLRVQRVNAFPGAPD